MLPAALTILITLQTTAITSDRIYVGSLVAFWALLVQGLISLMRRWISRRSYGKLIREIRARMPARPPIIPEQLVSPTARSEPEMPRLEGDEMR
jgi:hypothetical protein